MKMEMVMMKIKIVTKMKADQFFLQGARVGQRLQPPTFLQDCEQKPPRNGELVCIYISSCYLNYRVSQKNALMEQNHNGIYVK